MQVTCARVSRKHSRRICTRLLQYNQFRLLTMQRALCYACARSASVWAITASSTTYVTLAEGVPQAGFIRRGVYDYYIFTTRALLGSVTFTLQPLSGELFAVASSAAL